MKEYLFILGRNPSLSAEEIYAVLPTNSVRSLSELLVRAATSLEPEFLQRRLGGTVKIAEVVDTLSSFERLSADTIVDLVKRNCDTSKKAVFGVSTYGFTAKQSEQLYRYSIEAKKILKRHSISSRVVQQRTTALSSVAVTKNNLIDREFIFASEEGQITIAITRSVQDFESYGSRDFARPERDSHRGMLPPKVAQVMLNLAQVDRETSVLDPFCGVGTIVQEALLMGVSQVYASDKDPKAIQQTEANIAWLRKTETVGKVEVKVISASNLRQWLDQNTLDAIVTEPYLGPARELVRGITQQRRQQVISELVVLYRSSLEQFAKILKPGGYVVMIWPVIVHNSQNHFLPLFNDLRKIGFNAERPRVISSKLPGLSTRNTLLYERPGQRVLREVLVLRKG